MSQPGEPYPGAAASPDGQTAAAEQQAAAAAGAGQAPTPEATPFGAHNQDPLAGVNVPEHLKGIITPDFVSLLGGVITQREVNIAAYVAGSYANLVAAGQQAPQAAQAAEGAQPPANKPEVIKNQEWFTHFPSTYRYEWGAQGKKYQPGSIMFGSEAGAALYDALDEREDLPQVGIPAELAAELAAPDRKHDTDGLHEVIAFSELPDNAELRALIEMPDAVDVEKGLVVVDYIAEGYVPLGENGKPVLDRVELQMVLPRKLARNLDRAMQEGGASAVRRFMHYAFAAERAATKGTDQEESVEDSTRELARRFKMMGEYFDTQPLRHAKIASNVPGIGPDATVATAVDGYLTTHYPLKGAGEGAPAAPATGDGGGLVGKGLRGAWRVGKRLGR